MKVIIDESDFNFLLTIAAVNEQRQDRLRQAYDMTVGYKPYEYYLEQVKSKIKYEIIRE